MRSHVLTPAVLAAAILVPSALSAADAQTPSQAPAPLTDPREVHLADVVQITDGGENAEAYWSPDGSELVLQSTHGEYACDQIFRVAADGSGPMRLVSTGKGRTTCSYFTYPKGERILYATTHLDSPDCPPSPDYSQGYVWALYPGYDIVSVRPDGSDLVRLTDSPGYDAEGTICPVDGSVIFTSVRDGDLDLYRMDPDGSNVTRLTDTPGYDGGAFFSPDCSKIVWRASHPDGEELEDYRRLLAQGLIRPKRLDLWVANADGSEAHRVTYLGVASFAPAWFPSGDRLIFSSNYGDPQGREFDLWAVNVDGTGLERLTYTPEFDGFPLFSPDGKRLVFASNRHHRKAGETNIFVARWVDSPSPAPAAVPNEALPDELRAPDRYLADVAWLADDARDGRGVGTPGIVEARDWLVERFRSLGLEPAGEDGTYLQAFQVPVAVEVGEGTALAIDGAPVAADAFVPAGFSASASVAGPVVSAGYGITSPEQGIDDYAGLDVTGKVVAVRRFTPEAVTDDTAKRRLSDLRSKAFTAREHGAVGLIVVDLPGEGVEEAPLPDLRVDTGSDAGIPVMITTREAAGALFEPAAPGAAGAEAAPPHAATLTVALARRDEPAWNVVGRLAAGRPGAPEAAHRQGTVILGAHYDHLGFGGPESMAPGIVAPHNGADDNASGVAAVLEAARTLVARRSELDRDVLFVAFSGEESGVLGSTAFARHPPAGLDLYRTLAMINLDMVGRLREKLTVLGIESADEWQGIVLPKCRELDLPCALGGEAYGPSDHTPFYAAGVPVLFLFTGSHDDYHKPSDDWQKINAAGGARVSRLAADVAFDLADREAPLTYERVAPPPPRGDVRSYGASLGVVPDYAGPGEGTSGLLLAGVRPGGPAEEAGMRRDDLLVELAGHEIRDVYDLVFVLRQAKPGQTTRAVVVRGGERVELTVTFGETTRAR